MKSLYCILDKAILLDLTCKKIVVVPHSLSCTAKYDFSIVFVRINLQTILNSRVSNTKRAYVLHENRIVIRCNQVHCKEVGGCRIRQKI